jgi:hypothetical protein
MNELYAWAQKSPTKQLVSLRLDRDVLAHFRSSGRGRQGRINAALSKALSAKPHTHRVSFDHLCRAQHGGRRHCEAERPGSLEIDDQLVASGRLSCSRIGLACVMITFVSAPRNARWRRLTEGGSTAKRFHGTVTLDAAGVGRV